jgi:hypothetical protein
MSLLVLGFFFCTCLRMPVHALRSMRGWTGTVHITYLAYDLWRVRGILLDGTASMPLRCEVDYSIGDDGILSAISCFTLVLSHHELKQFLCLMEYSFVSSQWYYLPPCARRPAVNRESHPGRPSHPGPRYESGDGMDPGYASSRPGPHERRGMARSFLYT